MKNNKQKSKSFSSKKIIFVVLLSFSLSLFPLHKSQAALWPAIDPIIKQGLEEIYDYIQGAIRGALKQQAAKMLNEQVNKMVGGGGKSGGAMFITNWEDYLKKNPESNAKSFINDYLSQITKGKGSTTGYVSKTGSGSASSSGKPAGIGKGSKSSPGSNSGLSGLLGEGFSKLSGNKNSYVSQLVQGAKKDTSEKKDPKVTYTGNPSQMLSGGNFKDLNLFLSGINNPWAFNLNATNKFEEKKKEEKKIASTKATANNGFKSVGEDKKGKGNVKAPGSLVKDITANSKDLGSKIIAGATNPMEIITAIVSQIVNQTLSQGLGGGMGGKIGDLAKKALGDKVKTGGPGAAFGNPSTTKK